MRLILNIRGNSGSGKSTIAHQLMESFPTEKLDIDAKGRPNNYMVQLSRYRKLFIIGRYETQCGGCDQVGSSEEVMRRVEHYQTQGNVLYEGLLLSTTYGAMGLWSKQWGKRMVYAFLDTPLEVCLRRVEARRETAGNTKPFNPDNTIKRHKAVASAKVRIIKEGHVWHSLNYLAATNQVLTLLEGK